MEEKPSHDNNVSSELVIRPEFRPVAIKTSLLAAFLLTATLVWKGEQAITHRKKFDRSVSVAFIGNSSKI